MFATTPTDGNNDDGDNNDDGAMGGVFLHIRFLARLIFRPSYIPSPTICPSKWSGLLFLLSPNPNASHIMFDITIICRNDARAHFSFRGTPKRARK